MNNSDYLITEIAGELCVEPYHELILQAIRDLQQRYATREQSHIELGETLAPMVEEGKLPADMREAVKSLVDFQALAFEWFQQQRIFPVPTPGGDVLWGWYDENGEPCKQACGTPFDAAIQQAKASTGREACAGPGECDDQGCPAHYAPEGGES